MKRALAAWTTAKGPRVRGDARWNRHNVEMMGRDKAYANASSGFGDVTKQSGK